MNIYTDRRFMNSQGHITPKKFNPPVHWNELYDNKLWWGIDNEKNRKKFYSLKNIEVEADKAKEIGCEALYFDPGWDTNFASTIWAEDRLGKIDEFVKLMRRKYKLKVSLYTPYHPIPYTKDDHCNSYLKICKEGFLWEKVESIELKNEKEASYWTASKHII